MKIDKLYIIYQIYLTLYKINFMIIYIDMWIFKCFQIVPPIINIA